jgi:hypothetical protein
MFLGTIVKRFTCGSMKNPDQKGHYLQNVQGKSWGIDGKGEVWYSIREVGGVNFKKANPAGKLFH